MTDVKADTKVLLNQYWWIYYEICYLYITYTGNYKKYITFVFDKSSIDSNHKEKNIVDLFKKNIF